MRKSFNNQRDIYFESQSLKKHLSNKALDSELSQSKALKYSPQKFSPQKYSPRKYSPPKYSPAKYSPLKYERKSPFKIEERSQIYGKSPKKPLEVFEESKKKIYQEMLINFMENFKYFFK